MKEHPVLFSTEMVKALLDGKKSQTRRIIKPQPINGLLYSEGFGYWFESRRKLDGHIYKYKCPYGQVGDRLWVRETFYLMFRNMSKMPVVVYKADQSQDEHLIKWKPSIFMPRWASRITLEITDIKVERLQDIDELGALNEGTPEKYWDLQQGDMQTSAGIVKGPFLTGTAVKAYSKLWDSINGKKHSWESNPWCWCIEFKRIV